MPQQTKRQAKQHKRQDKASREAMAPAGSDTPAALAGTSPSGRAGVFLVSCNANAKRICQMPEKKCRKGIMLCF
jgi:hypothetical protein